MSSDNAQCSSTGVTWNSLEPVVDLAMNNGDFVPELADSHNLVACVAELWIAGYHPLLIELPSLTPRRNACDSPDVKRKM